VPRRTEERNRERKIQLDDDEHEEEEEVKTRQSLQQKAGYLNR
jgi:hypothetical protein